MAYVDIPGATASTHLLGIDDVDATLRCVVTATNVDGFDIATSNEVGPIAAAADATVTAGPADGLGSAPAPAASAGASVAAPAASGSGAGPVSGASGGGWEDISGETDPTYVPSVDDIGLNLRCVVTATNGSGFATAASNEVGPVDSPGPTIVTAPAASATGRSPAPSVGGLGWEDIPGETSSTFVPGEDEVDRLVRCVVTATNGSGFATATSNELGPIAEAVPVSATVVAPAADAVGASPTSEMPISATIVTGPASATGGGPAPSIDAVSADATVVAPAATATGSMPVPAVAASASVTAPAADATGSGGHPSNEAVPVAGVGFNSAPRTAGPFLQPDRTPVLA